MIENLSPHRSHTAAMKPWALNPTLFHLNHGSFGAIPQAVKTHQDDLRTTQQHAPVSWFATLPEKVDNARTHVAHILGVPPKNCILTANASSAASTIFNSLRVHPGAKVIVTNHGYGAVSMGARRFAQRFNAELTTISIPFGPTKQKIIELISPHLQTGNVLIVDHITSATSTIFPVKEICDLARQKGTISIVDGAHAPGVIDHPCHEVDCDFWFGNFHKFACAPAGCAALVVHPRFHQQMWPITDSWGADLEFPYKFNYNGTSDLTSYLSAPFAWNYIDNTWGWENVRHYYTQVLDEGTELITAALERSWDYQAKVVLPEPVSCMRLIALPPPLYGPREVVDTYRIRMRENTPFETGFTSFDGKAYLRLSAHIYNTIEDYQQFADKGVSELLSWITNQTVHKNAPTHKE
ncbi:MAG: aminotransferase class V-fold PLP-dependent enzyme [Actinomycetaceae bacterium]|nr:aminotransferase class V-fold PLP-dependent enzyme [Actinomycetaceae bacterium]